MKPNQYGAAADPMQLIIELRRDLDNLTAELKRRSGVPVTQASAPFFIPSASAPAAPGSGAYLYVSGNEVRVRAPSLDYSTNTPSPVAGAVTNAPNITSGSAPGTYNSTWGAGMYDGLVGTKDAHNALLTSLRNAGIVNT